MAVKTVRSVRLQADLAGPAKAGHDVQPEASAALAWSLLLRPAADLEADGSADESEALAKLVDEEALVGEMKRRGNVGEEDERRGCDADLRGIHDTHVLAAGADRRICGRDGFDELVENRRRNALAPGLGDLVDGLDHLRRAFPGERRNVQNRCVIEEPHPVAQIVVERLREVEVLT